jgi:hypothetical protein
MTRSSYPRVQGRSEMLARRAAARVANVLGPLRRHWDDRKYEYDAGTLRFSTRQITSRNYPKFLQRPQQYSPAFSQAETVCSLSGAPTCLWQVVLKCSESSALYASVTTDESRAGRGKLKLWDKNMILRLDTSVNNDASYGDHRLGVHTSLSSE